MDLVGPLLIFTMVWKFCTCLYCYSCEQCPIKFEETDKYLTLCEHSSMCFKRVSTLDFGNGKTSQAIQRGCAAQTQEGEQKKINRKWVQVQNIYEVYEEGCSYDTTYPERATKSLMCYCRGDRCNGEETERMITHAL